MKKLMLFLTLAVPAFAQGFENTSIQTSQPPPQSFPTTTLHTSAQLVIVDVVVTDKDHHPIHNLTAHDFVLREDNVSQPIKNFEEHTSAGSGSFGEMPVMPAGVFTNFTPTPPNGPLNILLFDRFNTQLRDQSNLRLQLLKFIDAAKPGTRMAILDLGDQIRLLQGFTDDRELLRAALRDKDGPVEAHFGGNSNDPGQRELYAPLQCTVTYTRNLVMRAAMQFLSLYLGNIPGRKNLLWFSGAYPLHLFPTGDKECLLTAEDFRQAVAKLAANQVSIYSIGVRTGLNGSGLNESAVEMALETGGRAFDNANALDEETAEAIDDGSNYYTLAYEPANANWNGGYRNIVVKLTDGRPGELTFRHGYYANDPNKPVKTAIFGHGSLPKEARPDAMHMALMLGVPDASEVVFAARVMPSITKMSETLAGGNEGSKGLNGPYQQYTVHLAADLRTIMLTESSDGARHGSLEFVTFVYDLKANVVNAAGHTIHADLKPAVYGQVLRDGLPLEMEVSVPAKGEYTLRIAVHDLNNDHVGAIEVPVSSVRNLPPAQVSVSATTPSPK